MTRPLSPRTARRHAGRAIRRARREQAQRHARLSATNWTALANGLASAFETFGIALADLAVAFARVTTDIAVGFARTVAAALAASAAEQRRAHRDWMLTHRALEPLARPVTENAEEN